MSVSDKKPNQDDVSIPPVSPRLSRWLLHENIETGQKRLRWGAVAIVSSIWMAFAFHIFAGGICLSYTVKRYYSDPRMISLITTLNVVIMLGPFVSYISDNIWTRTGRRKPFLLVAFAASAWGMAVIAFIPEVNSFLNLLGHALGLPSLREPILLIAVVISYTTLMDFSAVQEPLLLECVPPSQRGRFFALRNVMTNLSSLYFYQIFWPVYDEPVDLLRWLGWPGHWILRGEQIVYVISSGLFLVAIFVMVFCIRERREPNAPNKKLRELGIWKFVVNYVRDVFLERSVWPFYIIMVIPGLASAVWGQGATFDAMMKTDQFQYSKAQMALMGVPPMLISMILLTPFAGWYSDAKPRLSNTALLLVGLFSAGCFVSTRMYYPQVLPEDIRILPEMHHCLAMSTLVAVGGMGIFVILVELAARRFGRTHIRALVSFIAVIKDMLVQIAFFVYIQFLAPDGVPPIAFWMVFTQFGATLGTLIGVTVGPMIYEYIPRNRLGTILAGKGLMEGFLRFGVANLGAFWLVWWSLHIHKPNDSEYDYSSLYFLQAIFYIPAILVNIWFLRAIFDGRLRQLGVLELEEGTE